MSTTDEIILLTDEFTGLEYSWRKTGAADSTVNNVLTKNIGNYKYERIFEVADVRWWGVSGDGTDESAKLSKMLLDIKDNRKVNEVAFYGLEKVIVDSTLEIKRGDLIIDGKNCELSSSRFNDIVIFNIEATFLRTEQDRDENGVLLVDENGQPIMVDVYEYYNNVNIKNFISINESTAQTFVKAKSSHYLRITDCRFDGMKLGFDLNDCYFTKLNSVYFQGTYQAFKFYNGTNAFNVTNLKILGGGIPSEIINTTTGGNISGCSFEDASGRLVIDRSFGINITGNYFEGYNENKVDTYIKLSLSARYENVAGINIAGNLFYTGAMQAIKLDNVVGISITGNFIGTLHALNLSGNGDSTQRNINYNGNAWRYTPSQQGGISVAQASEYIGEYDGGRGNASPEWNVPIIFTPQVFHARFLEDGNHHFGATAIDASTTANYMEHTWKTNGKKTKAYLNGSIDLLPKKYFNANEANEIDIEPFGFGSTLGTLMLQNHSGQFAMFLWQRDIENNLNKGYFKPIVNDLGVSIVHNNGKITITNGNTAQWLKAELKV